MTNLELQKADYEQTANKTCTKHDTYDGVVYIVDYAQGFWVIKFYDNQCRVGGMFPSSGEAYSYAMSWM